MNFRGILSKSSLRSSSSGKSLSHSDDVSKLQSEIESLKQTIDSLKVSVESRDAAIGTLAREKEKLYAELKSAQRTNRNIHQQIVDERDIHSKEKEFLINEIKRLSKRSEDEMLAKQNKNACNDQSNYMFNELKTKDEIIYNIGAKYMKMKSSKVALQKKLDKLQIQNKKTCENIIFLLQDNRKSLDTLLDNLLKSSTVSPNSKKYLNLLQINANLHYENTQLKIYLSAQDSDMFQQELNCTEEQSEKTCYTNKHSRSRAKSEMKIRNVSEKVPGGCRSIHSKLISLNNHAPPTLTDFKYTHLIFSPKVRRTFYRSASDSCLLRKNLSERLNNKYK